jgi:uncharacterized RDD family membrane protein YckC
MESTNVCSLCDVTFSNPTQIRQIYGSRVCESCHDDFAFRRGLAFFMDAMASNIVIMPAILLGFLFFGSQGPVHVDVIERHQTIRALTIMALIAIPVLFILLKDGFRGTSPGKALFGLQVINVSNGETGAFLSSVRRTLPLMVPFMPIYIGYQLFQNDGKRLGDTWADTKVISKQHRAKAPFRSQTSIIPLGKSTSEQALL